MPPTPAGPQRPPESFRLAAIRLPAAAIDPDPEDPDWDAILPDDEEAHPEPGDFWIEDDDWQDAA